MGNANILGRVKGVWHRQQLNIYDTNCSVILLVFQTMTELVIHVYLNLNILVLKIK